MADRRTFLKTGALTGAGLLLPWKMLVRKAYAQIAGGSLPPGSVTKFLMPLVIPPAMPRTKTISSHGQTIDYYEIAVRQFTQQILPTGLPPTTVWGYGSVQTPATFNYPAFTIESQWRRPARVKWINQLVDSNNNYLPHLLPVDQTLHWANPPGPRDAHGMSQAPYTGPVPMIVHVHGSHATQDSDGYAEAWYLPNAKNIPAGFSKVGSFYSTFESLSLNGSHWTPGSAVFQYANDQRAATIWYHDHSLGMTRLNVYAGPAGFFLLRGGPDDVVTIKGTNGQPAVLPGPAPGVGANPFGTFFEIPIAIQDRSFNTNGSLFYPNSRAFFEGLNKFVGAGTEPPYLNIPFHPDIACDGQPSDVAPIANPEFFGNMMLVNGRTWPFLTVQKRRYRFRILNGCNGRFLILKFSHPGVTAFQIGAEGGFLPEPVNVTGGLLMSPAERADVIVDFANASGNVVLQNLGPDEPFGGPGFDPADPGSTGQVMEFRVTGGAVTDPTTPPQDLQLPTVPTLPTPDSTRDVSLNEEESANVFVTTDENGSVVLDCDSTTPFGPTAALLGAGAGPGGLKWDDPVTENPGLGDTENWVIHNHTADAHPIHIHEVQFRVVSREPFGGGTSLAGSNDPLPTEAGFKDTVIAYPGERTTVQSKFDLPGQYVWHCHIVEHEDNEMMRPFRVGP
jgi:FtsP/CotA-like multicopper oxidase with cupredoxin domain